MSPEARRLAGGNPKITVECRDQSASDGVAVYCCDGRPRVLEEAQIRFAVLPIPLTDLVLASTAEDVEAVLKVDPSREHVALARQHDWQVAELAFEPVKGPM